MKMWLVIVCVLCFAIITACKNENKLDVKVASPNEKTIVSEAEAINIAEEFVRTNGYTDLPPATDRTKLSFETIEWESDIEEMLKSRHNTLQRKAFGVLSRRKGHEAGWTVVFQIVLQK
jgi:hypothetical protein